MLVLSCSVEFRAELDLLQRLRHPNVVQFLSNSKLSNDDCHGIFAKGSTFIASLLPLLERVCVETVKKICFGSMLLS